MIVKLIWRNLWRNSRRSMITIASIMFAVFLAIMMQSFQTGTFNNLIKNVVGYYTGYIQIHKEGYWDEKVLDNSFEVSDSLMAIIKNNASVTSSVFRLETFMLASSGNQTKGIFLIGTDMDQEKNQTHLEKKLIKGSYPINKVDGVLVAEGLASKLNIGVNDTLVLLGQGYHGSMAAQKVRVNGIIKLASPQMNEVFVYMPLHAAQYLLNAENLITSVALGIDDSKNMRRIKDNLNTKLSYGYEVMDWQQMMPEISNHIRSDNVSFYIFTGVLYLIIGFGFLGTVMMMIAERKYEFGMLIAIGMKKSKIIIMLLGETLLITFAGIFLGILLSLPLVIYLNRNPLRFTGEIGKAYEQFGFEAVMPTELDQNTIVIQSTIVLIIALLVGLYPLLNILKLNSLEAMKR